MSCKLLVVIASLLVVASLDRNQVTGRVVEKLGSEGVVLFNFTDPAVDMSGWTEVSDTVREPGKSKALLVLQKTQVFQRAVFFALLNPQPNGAAFAGVRHPIALQLFPASSITIKCRAQGSNSHFKIALKHHGQQPGPVRTPSYEYYFEAPGGDELQYLNFPLLEFKPYINGVLCIDCDPLDTGDITSFGIQVYGGVNEEVKQSGPEALEIDWIKAANYC